LNTKEVHVKVQFYRNDIVRVVKWSPEGTPDKLSLSVIQNELPALNIIFEETADSIVLKSPVLSVCVSKTDGNIDYK
jgi:hypothetical protein